MEPVTTAAAAPAAEPTTQTPTAPAIPAAVVTAPKPLSKQERRDQLIARMRQGNTPADDTAGVPDPVTTDADKPAEPAADEPEKPETDEKPAEPPKPADDTELKLATYKRELKNAKADLLEMKPLADKARVFEEQLAKAKEDPNAALGALKTLFGRDFGELTQWFVENKDTIKTHQKYAELPPDVREEIALARKEREQRAASEKQATEQKALVEKHSTYSKKIAEHLATHEDEFPLSSAWGKDVADDIARQVIAAKGPVDARALIQKYESAMMADFTASLTNEKLVRQLLARKPELKAVLAPLVGAASATATQPNKSPTVASQKPNGQPAQADTPPALTNRSAASDVSAPPRPASRAERVREIKEAFKRYQSAG